MRNSEYSRGAKWSRILTDSSVIPNPEPTAWMNIYTTILMFHKINHPSRSTFRLSCPNPPFLPFAISYVPPYVSGEREYTQTFICKWHAVIAVWAGGNTKGRKMERDSGNEVKFSQRCHLYWGVVGTGRGWMKYAQIVGECVFVLFWVP